LQAYDVTVPKGLSLYVGETGEQSKIIARQWRAQTRECCLRQKHRRHCGRDKGRRRRAGREGGWRRACFRHLPVLRNIDFFWGTVLSTPFAARSFIFHLIVPSMSSSTASSTIHQNVVPSEVGWQFVPQYYTFVNKQPNRLHCFYTKSSTFVHGTEGEECKPCYGQHVRCITFLSLRCPPSLVFCSVLSAVC